jgi:hypothetical protein
MSLHAYQKNSLIADYLRGGIGFAVTAFPVVFAPMMGTFQIIFALISLVFAGFLLKTWLRAQTRVEVADEGIRTLGPFGKSIAWPDLTAMELRYYSTQKDKAKGWMHLVLKGGDGAKISIESTLDGFDTVLEHAAAAAGRNGVALNQTTTENLAAAGVSMGLAAGDR